MKLLNCKIRVEEQNASTHYVAKLALFSDFAILSAIFSARTEAESAIFQIARNMDPAPTYGKSRRTPIRSISGRRIPYTDFEQPPRPTAHNALPRYGYDRIYIMFGAERTG